MKQAHEFWVTNDTEEAVRKAKITMKRVGELTRVVPGDHIEGEMKFGMHPVKMSVTWRAETAQAAAEAAAERKVTPGGDAKIAPPPAMLTPAAAMIGGGLGTTLVLEVDYPDQTGAAHRNVMERFEDAYMHFDRPDYAPDRLGVLPVTIIFVVVALIIIALLIMNTSKIRKSLGVTEPTASASVEATSGP